MTVAQNRANKKTEAKLLPFLGISPNAKFLKFIPYTYHQIITSNFNVFVSGI